MSFEKNHNFISKKSSDYEENQPKIQVIMNSNISGQELDSLLKEVNAPHPSGKEESLQKLLDEIMGPVQLQSPASPILADKIPTPFVGKKNLISSKFRLLPLLLSMAFLGGIFLGTVFGFYWASRKVTELTIMAKQLQEIYDQITPTSPDEIITPLETPEEFEKLAPERVM